MALVRIVMLWAKTMTGMMKMSVASPTTCPALRIVEHVGEECKQFEEIHEQFGNHSSGVLSQDFQSLVLFGKTKTKERFCLIFLLIKRSCPLFLFLSISWLQLSNCLHHIMMSPFISTCS